MSVLTRVFLKGLYWCPFSLSWLTTWLYRCVNSTKFFHFHFFLSIFLIRSPRIREIMGSVDASRKCGIFGEDAGNWRREEIKSAGCIISITWGKSSYFISVEFSCSCSTYYRKWVCRALFVGFSTDHQNGIRRQLLVAHSLNTCHSLC